MRLQLMATADGRIWFRVLMLVALAIIILPVAAASAPSKSDAKRSNLKKFVGPNACAECHKEVKRVLDLEMTNRDLCSFKCEAKYWLDIVG